MGWDLWSIGKHGLRLGDIKEVAQQLSDALNINIEYGLDSSGWKKKKVFGQIITQPGTPIYSLDRILSYEYPRYELDFPFDNVKTPDYQIQYLDIYNEIVSISLWSEPGRWRHYYQFFSNEDQTLPLEALRKYRIAAKECYGKLGARQVYCFADQGPTELIGDHLQDSWENLETYILSGSYYDECLDPTYIAWKKDARIINVPAFLTGKYTVPSKIYGDVFFDDFSDLD